jgi:DNA mismatch repair protein MSH6
VPATSCDFSVVDQIHTRIGANDRILENLSTFKLELAETKSILDNSRERSLVIMDELGRGTSTFDGYSIAHSVLRYLTDTKPCRLMFTTHYHWLVDDFRAYPGIGLFHMMIDQSEETAPTDQEIEVKTRKRIKFLYKFGPGVALQSFGVCVGELAGLPHSVLEKAEVRATAFSKQLQAIRDQRKQ